MYFADMCSVGMYFADMCFVNVCFVDMCFVDMCFVDMCFVGMYFADMYFADMYFANMYFDNMYFINLYNNNYNTSVVGFAFPYDNLVSDIPRIYKWWVLLTSRTSKRKRLDQHRFKIHAALVRSLFIVLLILCSHM